MLKKFPRSASKLEQVRQTVDDIDKSTDPITMATHFNSFLAHARGVTFALQKEGRHVTGFDEWYGTRQSEMKRSQLLVFIRDARTDDHHKGESSLEFFAEGTASFDDLHAATGGGACIIDGSEGIFRVQNQGTPQERRVPVRVPNIDVGATVRNPPTDHLGTAVHPSPRLLVRQALEYYERLLFEAEERFGERSPNTR